MANPGKLSASKLTTYKGCSLAYFLKYIAHEEIPVNVRLAFGKDIHYMLENFYKKNFKSEDTFSKFWKRRWFSVVSGDFLRGKQKKKLEVAEYRVGKKDFVLKVGNHISMGENPVGVFFGYMKLGEGILKRFYERHIIEKRENGNNRKPPEHVELDFGNRKTEPCEVEGCLIRGVFDRIEKTSNGFFITDYKTDKSSPGKNSFVLHRNPQFTLYSYVFRKIFNEKETAMLYYHLRSGNVFKTHRSEKDYDYLKSLISDVAEGITKDKFTPFYGFHCNFCDYQTACEKYSIEHHGGPRIDLEGRISGADKFNDWDIESDGLNWIDEFDER